MEKSENNPISLEFLVKSDAPKKMSPKGTIVIPASLRKQLGIRDGTNFIYSIVKLNSQDGEYRNREALLLLPVSVEYIIMPYFIH